MENDREVTDLVSNILKELTNRELGAMAVGFLFGALSEQTNQPCDLQDPRKVLSGIFSALHSIPMSYQQLDIFAELVKAIRDSHHETVFEALLKEVQNEG